MQNEIIKFMSFGALFIFVLGLAQAIHKAGISGTKSRKLSHMLGAIVAAFLPYFLKLDSIIVLGLLFFALLLFSSKRRLLGGIHNVKRNTIGAFLFPVGIILSALLFKNQENSIYAMSILIMGLSDGIAGIVGETYGKHKYNFTSEKTIEGSTSFFVVTTIIILVGTILNSSVHYLQLPLTLMIAVIITIIEGISGKGWDNLTVPIISGLLLQTLL